MSQGLWLQGPGGPEAGVSLLVGGAGSQGVPGLVLAHWWAEPDPRVSGSRAQGSKSRCWTAGGWGQFLTQLAAGSGMYWSLCWPAGK